MHSVVDERLLAEQRRYRLRYACEHCAFYAPDTGACSERFPNAEHRQRPLEAGQSLVFCKRFELC